MYANYYMDKDNKIKFVYVYYIKDVLLLLFDCIIGCDKGLKFII